MKRSLRFSFLLISSTLLFVLHCTRPGTGPKPEPIPKILSGPQVIDIQTNTATISWETDINSSSVVRYGTQSNTYPNVVEDNTPVLLHQVKLVGLQPNTEYFYQVESATSGGSATSAEERFTTKMTFAQLTDTAWAHYSTGDFSTAISYFNQMLETRPNFPEALNGLGWCYAANQMDSLEKALTYFDQANRAKQDYADALAGRGFVHLALGNYFLASQDLQAVLDLQPNYVFAHDETIDHKDVRLALAEAQFYLKHYSVAQAQLNVLAPTNNLDPDNSETWVVDGTHYASYVEALLAWLEKVKSLIG